MSYRYSCGCVAESLENRMLLSMGQLDPTFSSDGIVSTNFNGGLDDAHAVAVQADGKVLAAGIVELGPMTPVTEIGVVRYNADGSLDDGSSSDSTPGDHFGTGGKFTFAEGLGANVSSMAIQKDGKILLAGWGEPTDFGPIYWLVLRLNPNGTLDKTFGKNGEATFKFTGEEAQINAMAVQSDGKIVLAGSERAIVNVDNDFLIGRL